MLELFNQSIAVVNLPYTLLLGLVLFYWTLYISGAVGAEVLDMFGVDLDAGGDMDVDANGNVEFHGVGSVFKAALHFFHVGEVPTTIIATLLIMLMWTCSIVVNYTTGNDSLLLAGLLFFPNLFVALLLTKIILKPFLPLLKQVFSQEGDVVEVVGKTCTVMTPEVTGDYGQAEMQTGGSPLLLNVKTKNGEVLQRGDDAVIYEYDQEKNTYFITKLIE